MNSKVACDDNFQLSGAVIKEVDTLILILYYDIFSVETMIVIETSIVLFIYWTLHRNKPMDFNLCVFYLGGIVGDVSAANLFC